MLSPRLLEVLRAYWVVVRPRLWLFPGDIADQPISTCQRPAYTGQPRVGINRPPESPAVGDAGVGIYRPARSRHKPATVGVGVIPATGGPQASRSFIHPRGLPSGLFAREVAAVGRRRIEMFQYRQVLVRLRAGDTVREIARCGLMGRDKLGALRPWRSSTAGSTPAPSCPTTRRSPRRWARRRRASSTISSVEPHREVVQRWFEAGVQGRAIHAALQARARLHAAATRPSCACCAACARAAAARCHGAAVVRARPRPRRSTSAPAPC